MKTIPPLDSFSTTLPEKRVTRGEYLTEISKRKLECATIRARMQSASPDPGNERLNRVNALLGRSTAPVVQPDDMRLQTLLVEIQDLQNAVSVIDRQIEAEEQAASRKLVKSEWSEIERRGNKYAKAFVDFYAAHLDFDEHLDRLEDVGASVGQFRVRPNGVSSPKDPSGSYFYGLREFIDAGFLSKSDTPKVFK
jgi:hypothetical protein